MSIQLHKGLTTEKPGDYTNFHHPAASKEALYVVNSKVKNCVARAFVALAITLAGAVAGTVYHIGKAFLPKEEGTTQLRLAITCILRGIVAPFIAINFATCPKEYGYKEITWRDRHYLIHDDAELSTSKFKYFFTLESPGKRRENPEKFYFETYKLSDEALNQHLDAKKKAEPTPEQLQADLNRREKQEMERMAYDSNRL